MESPYAYLFAGRHDRAAEVIRHVLQYQFTTGKGGLPGNDDSGGLSSWYVWSSIGIFPAAGLPYMLIGSPYFDKATIKMRGGEFMVEANNQAPDHCFVQSATLNGKPLDRCYLKMTGSIPRRNSYWRWARSHPTGPGRLVLPRSSFR